MIGEQYLNIEKKPRGPLISAVVFYTLLIVNVDINLTYEEDFDNDRIKNTSFQLSIHKSGRFTDIE